MNTLTIDNAKFENNYLNDKYDTSHSVGYGEANEMAEWIFDQFKEFWIFNTENKK